MRAGEEQIRKVGRKNRQKLYFESAREEIIGLIMLVILFLFACTLTFWFSKYVHQRERNIYALAGREGNS